MSKRIAVVGPLAPFAGYGIIVEQLVIWFAKLGYEPTMRPTMNGEKFGATVDPEVKRRIVDTVQPEPWELIVHTPEHHHVPGKRTVHFTMWESTRLSMAGVRNLQEIDKSGGVIITPSQWGASCFSAQGVDTAQFVVPLGVNPDAYQYDPMVMDGPTIFGCGGRLAHGGSRKGVNEVIDVFLKAFPTERDVRLRVKIFTDCPVKDPGDNRIEFYKDFLPEQEMAQWFKQLTAFVSLARSEGWGLFTHQSMTCGRPVIGCRFSGHAEFMTERNSYCVSYRQRQVDGFYKDCGGKWAAWDEASAIKHMRSVYTNRKLASRKGMEAAQDVKHLTWENTARETLKVLQAVGMCS